MTYIISKSDGTALVSLPDRTINVNACPLQLLGRNTPNYGTSVATNFVKLTENFSNSAAPTSPLKGMVWHDTTVTKLKLYDGTNWNPIASEAWVTAAINGAGFQQNIGFTPVQQGGGPYASATSTTKLNLAYNDTNHPSKLVFAVNGTDTGVIATEAWVSTNYQTRLGYTPQTPLGFTPVRQGGGKNQSTQDTIYLGYEPGTGKVSVQVDSNYDGYGALATETWSKAVFQPKLAYTPVQEGMPNPNITQPDYLYLRTWGVPNGWDGMLDSRNTIYLAYNSENTSLDVSINGNYISFGPLLTEQRARGTYAKLGTNWAGSQYGVFSGAQIQSNVGGGVDAPFDRAVILPIQPFTTVYFMMMANCNVSGTSTQPSGQISGVWPQQGGDQTPHLQLYFNGGRVAQEVTSYTMSLSYCGVLANPTASLMNVEVRARYLVPGSARSGTADWPWNDTGLTVSCIAVQVGLA